MRSARSSSRSGMARQVQESVHLRDGHALGPLRDSHDLVAGSDLAFLEHAQIEARFPCPMSSDAMRGSSMRMPTR